MHIKFIFLLISILLFFYTSSWGKKFSIEKQQTINKRISELQTIIIDTKNTCATDCRYKVPNVKEIKIVQKISDTHFFTWMYISSTKDSSNFLEVTIEKKSNTETFIRSSTPSEEKISELEKKTGLSNNTIFYKIESLWTLKENFNARGEFINTTVTYENNAASSSAIIRIFGKRVKSEMEHTADALFENLNLP